MKLKTVLIAFCRVVNKSDLKKVVCIREKSFVSIFFSLYYLLSLHMMEEVSGRNFSKFSQQWFYTAGQPELRIWHETGKKKGIIEVYIGQKQENLFQFNLELLIKDASGEKIENVFVKERVTKIMVPSMNDVVIIPDPNVNLLFK